MLAYLTTETTCQQESEDDKATARKELEQHNANIKPAVSK